MIVSQKDSMLITGRLSASLLCDQPFGKSPTFGLLDSIKCSLKLHPSADYSLQLTLAVPVASQHAVHPSACPLLLAYHRLGNLFRFVSVNISKNLFFCKTAYLNFNSKERMPSTPCTPQFITSAREVSNILFDHLYKEKWQSCVLKQMSALRIELSVKSIAMLKAVRYFNFF